MGVAKDLISSTSVNETKTVVTITEQVNAEVVAVSSEFDHIPQGNGHLFTTGCDICANADHKDDIYSIYRIYHICRTFESLLEDINNEINNCDGTDINAESIILEECSQKLQRLNQFVHLCADAVIPSHEAHYNVHGDIEVEQEEEEEEANHHQHCNAYIMSTWVIIHCTNAFKALKDSFEAIATLRAAFNHAVPYPPQPSSVTNGIKLLCNVNASNDGKSIIDIVYQHCTYTATASII